MFEARKKGNKNVMKCLYKDDASHCVKPGAGPSPIGFKKMGV